MTSLKGARSAIQDSKFAEEQSVVEHLIKNVPYQENTRAQIAVQAEKLVAQARLQSDNLSILDRFLAEYGLSNEEGVVLMCLAESLLRVPDGPTAKQLIADKISIGDWAAHANAADSLLVNASTLALMLTGTIVTVERAFTANPGKWLSQLANRLSEPVVEAAMRGAMEVLGREFVLGKTIETALQRADKRMCYSYDILGEAACTAAIAQDYHGAYLQAIRRVGEYVDEPVAGSSMSIKLSALHPRYEFGQHKRVLNELVPMVKSLCLEATKAGMDMTIDAEECDRLELSLDVFERLILDPDLADWQGLGIVVQAYSKRALPVLKWLASIADKVRKRIPLRLVKGAYWDAEIKNAQTMGYPGLPVFTRKWATDCSYLVCAKYLLTRSDKFRPQFATHNAHSIAGVMSMAGAFRDFEFQRLHGMGTALYQAANQVYDDFPSIRVYAPVGGYDDLLAYLVRRLLENGANSSFVNRFFDKSLSPADLVVDPFRQFDANKPVGHPDIRLAADIFAPERINSSGIDLTDARNVLQIEEYCKPSSTKVPQVTTTVSGKVDGGSSKSIRNPANNMDIVGEYIPSCASDIDQAMILAAREQPNWEAKGVAVRAVILEDAARGLEQDRAKLIELLCREAGKTIPDAIAEIREAIDFCRYYAAEARRLFAEPKTLPSPTGETNELSMQGRGVFVCISPWNFPLAIFIGQVTAALAAGNTVVAKPAEETPVIASLAIRILHRAGVPVNACHLILGDGAVGAILAAHNEVSGVAFTGSTKTARKINLALAKREGAIVPLIAETGGQNAMIADSTALLEQLTDDVVQSAFYSAGQRCSALRVLFLQNDIANATIKMIKGSMMELCLGNPARLRTDVGPIISHAAAERLEAHIQSMIDAGKPVFRHPVTPECDGGHFVAPTLIEIDAMDELTTEHFGPILHIVRYHSSELSKVISAIEQTGYGLTLGIHTRIESKFKQIAKSITVGNVYINRNMIGAVVGSQPFGGQGLSGTGPKAGGPHYLLRFCTEKVISTNTVATGGNAELLRLAGS